MLSVVPARRNRLLLLLAALGVIGFLLYTARATLFPFALGLVLAYLLLPAVNLVERLIPLPRAVRRSARPLAVLTLYTIFLASISLAVVFLVPPSIQRTGQFMTRVPDYFAQARSVAQEWSGWYQAAVPPEVQAIVNEQVDEAAKALGEMAQGVLARTIRVLSGTFSLVLGLATVPIWLFYFLKDQREMSQGFYALFPAGLQQDAREVVRIVDRVLTAYIRAQLLLGVIVGLLTAFGLLLLGVDSPFILGAIAGVTELVPIVGPILGAIPAVVVTLATSPGDVVWVVLLFVGIQAFENNFLVPRIQGEALHLHPALIIFLIVVASEVWGILGMVVVAPLAAVTRDAFLYLYRRLGDEGDVSRSSGYGT